MDGGVFRTTMGRGDDFLFGNMDVHKIMQEEWRKMVQECTLSQGTLFFWLLSSLSERVFYNHPQRDFSIGECSEYNT
jgi:hypothetical protein